MYNKNTNTVEKLKELEEDYDNYYEGRIPQPSEDTYDD
jgi:hypothetical protein